MNLSVTDSCDPAVWDEYVSGSDSGHFMQSYGWGSLQKRLGWGVRYLVLRSGKSIRAASLILSRKIPWTGKRVFCTPRGPVLDYGDRDTVAALSVALREVIRDQGGVFLRCDPYVPYSPAIQEVATENGFRILSRDWSYWNAPKLVLWLDVSSGEDAVFKNMASSTRNEIRIGYKRGVCYERKTRSEIDDFFGLMSSTARHKGLVVHDKHYYSQLYDTLSASCDVQLFFGCVAEKPVATGISVRYGKKAWLLYAASDPGSFQLKANRTLQWEMIRWAIAAGCERYDLRGTACNDPPRSEDPGFGVFKFKNSFGPKYVRLAGYFDIVGNPNWYRVLRLSEERALPIAYKCLAWLRNR